VSRHRLGVLSAYAVTWWVWKYGIARAGRWPDSNQSLSPGVDQWFGKRCVCV